MRTGCWLAIVCLLFLYGTQAAFGLQSSASDDLNITVSGVMVGDAQYEVFLEMGSSTASPCNWVYQSIQPVVASEQLPYVDGELNLVIPSLSYQGENYLLKLAFAADGQALPAMHWALTDMVEVAQSADLLSTQVLSSESDKQTLVRGINGFGLELFKQLAGSTEYEN